MLNEFFIRCLSKHISLHLNRASIGIQPILEQVFEKLLVKAVHGVIEGQQDKLRGLVLFEVPGDFCSATKTIGQPAVAGVTSLSLLAGAESPKGGHDQ